MNIRAVLLLIVVFAFPFSATAADLEDQLLQEVDGYIDALVKAEDNDLIAVAREITSSGLSDVRLFDNVKTILENKHQELLTEPDDDELLIYQTMTIVRTLASSGNDMYMPVLYNIMRESNSRGVRNRAKHVLSKIKFYRDRNAIMQNMDSHVDGQSLQSTRMLNLLKNDNLIMSRFASEEIVRKGSAEPAVQEWIAQRLEERVHKVQGKLAIDTYAWYCKVLGTVNKTKYADFLTTLINDKSVDSKIRKHAKKILKS